MQKEQQELRLQLKSCQGKLEQSNLEKDTMLAQNQELERRVALLEETFSAAAKRIAALEEEKKEMTRIAGEQDDSVVSRLNYVVVSLGAVTGYVPDSTHHVRVPAVLDAVTSTEESASVAVALLHRSFDILCRFHETIFTAENDKVPAGIDAVLKVFEKPAMLDDYTKEQTIIGASSAVFLARLHGIDGDWSKAFESLPGPEVETKSLRVSCRKLDERLVSMVDKTDADQAAEEAARIEAEKLLSDGGT